MLDALAGRGIDVAGCRVDPGRPTGASVILGRGDDRAILTAIGTIGDLRAADVPADVVARARHVHVGSLYLQSALRPGLAELLRAARAAGATVSVDPNWDPAGRWDPIDDVLAAGRRLPDQSRRGHRVDGRGGSGTRRPASWRGGPVATRSSS